ncbi:pore-forming ESAT-6 family protein [Streptomyces sp. NPDC018031]|uniref:pore-forming ESAT-6 family protein n=1 Tax=Streptomyces sp. NPDC018031 TaxID=3365033 RepID=UPI003787F334
MAGNQDRRSYDSGASGEAQGNIGVVIARLEQVLGDRDRAVKAAMADFTADGVADEYHAKELRWNRAAAEVRSIIQLVRTTLEKNDATAQQTLARAKAAVDGIG